MRYGSASSSDRRRELLGEPEPRREPGAVAHRDPGAAVLHGANPPRSRVGRRWICGSTAEQHALRAEARSVLRGHAAAARGGRASGGARGCSPTGTRVAVNRALWRGGLDRHVVARRARWARALAADATLVEEVFGYHWLPLSSYLLSYKTIGAAIERFAVAGARRAAAAADRPRRARLLPGLLRARSGQRSRRADDARRAPRRHVRRHGHKIWTSSAHLADWIYLAVRTDAGAAEAPRHLRARRPDRHARHRGAARSRRSAAGTSARRSSTASRFPSRTSSASSTEAGTC